MGEAKGVAVSVAGRSARDGTDWETVRRLASALPAVEESTSYGTPAFKVAGKLIVRQPEVGGRIVVRVDPGEREALVRAEPETFFVTPHYENYPYVLVELGAIDEEELREVLVDAWREVAPKRLRQAFESEQE